MSKRELCEIEEEELPDVNVDASEFTSWENPDDYIMEDVIVPTSGVNSCNSRCTGCPACSPAFTKNKEAMDQLRAKMFSGALTEEEENERAAQQLQIEQDLQFCLELEETEKAKSDAQALVLEKLKAHRNNEEYIDQAVNESNDNPWDFIPPREKEPEQLVKLPEAIKLKPDPWELIYPKRDQLLRNESCQYSFGLTTCACAGFVHHHLSVRCAKCGHLRTFHSQLQNVKISDVKIKEKTL